MQQNDTAHADRHYFADLARLGKNDWWRYLLSFVSFVLVGLAIFIGVYVVMWIVTGADPGQLMFVEGHDFSTAAGLQAAMTLFVFIMASLIVFLLSARIVFPLIHRRPWITYLTASDRFRYGEFLRSSGALIIVFAIATSVQIFFFPESIEYSLQLQAFLYFLPLVIVLTLFQILAEEVLVRGYLLQLVGLLTPVFVIRLLAPGVIFGLLHLWNPEVLTGGYAAIAVFILAGVYMTFLVLRSNGLEQAAGFHFANNVFVFSVVGNAADQFHLPTVFFDPSTTIDVFDLLVSLAVVALHFGVLKVWERRYATN